MSIYHYFKNPCHDNAKGIMIANDKLPCPHVCVKLRGSVMNTEDVIGMRLTWPELLDPESTITFLSCLAFLSIESTELAGHLNVND